MGPSAGPWDMGEEEGQPSPHLPPRTSPQPPPPCLSAADGALTHFPRRGPGTQTFSPSEQHFLRSFLEDEAQREGQGRAGFHNPISWYHLPPAFSACCSGERFGSWGRREGAPRKLSTWSPSPPPVLPTSPIPCATYPAGVVIATAWCQAGTEGHVLVFLLLSFFFLYFWWQGVGVEI